MSYEPSLDISVRFDAPAPLVWLAITNPECAKRWYPSLWLQAEKGGDFEIETPRPLKKRPRMIEGRIKQLEPGEELQIQLHSEPRGFDSRLTVIVSQLKHKSRLRFVEEGLPEEKNAQIIAAECREGWRDVLSSLDEFLAKKTNLALLRRAAAAN